MMRGILRLVRMRSFFRSFDFLPLAVIELSHFGILKRYCRKTIDGKMMIVDSEIALF
jgi:hypothetical protein